MQVRGLYCGEDDALGQRMSYTRCTMMPRLLGRQSQVQLHPPVGADFQRALPIPTWIMQYTLWCFYRSVKGLAATSVMHASVQALCPSEREGVPRANGPIDGAFTCPPDRTELLSSYKAWKPSQRPVRTQIARTQPI